MMGLGLACILGYNTEMKFIKKNWEKITLTIYTFLIPAISLAVDVSGVPSDLSGKIVNPIPNITSVPGLIQIILTGVLRVGIPVIALAVIYSGFLFVSARGKPEELTKAKDSLLYTLIGAAILLGSWAIAVMIQNTVTGLGS